MSMHKANDVFSFEPSADFFGSLSRIDLLSLSFLHFNCICANNINRILLLWQCNLIFYDFAHK